MELRNMQANKLPPGVSIRCDIHCLWKKRKTSTRGMMAEVPHGKSFLQKLWHMEKAQP